MAGHRYWRLLIHNNSGFAYLSIAELNGHTALGGSGQAFTGGTASSNPNNGGAASLAFDGNLGTKWWVNPWSDPAWIMYDLGVGVTKDIPEINIISAPANEAPTVADWQFSDDNITWTTYFSFSTTWTTFNQSQTFNTIQGTEVAQYPLIGVFQPSIVPQVQVAQYPLIGTMQPTPAAQVQVAQMLVIGVISNPHFGQIPQPFGLPCWSPCQNVIYMKGEIK